MEHSIDLKGIKEYMEFNNISQRELARRLKISNSALIKIFNAERNPGMKFIQGLFDIGFKTNNIFAQRKCQKSLDEANIPQYICDYMNAISICTNKEYKLYEIHNIRTSIELENEDRKKNSIKINGNTIDGRKKLNERITQICNKNFNTKLSYKDVQFYKKCTQLEEKDRNLINSIEEENEDD
ncbi:helix-turn-helix domain-containing protein [Clostridium tagluense]|uniref:helix-turn-helix domain-containing protein n=1 Tax=Clostridium tagluense TaxID=360422 RepID=UPI001CF4A7CE|nr:helix-turn-helix transcriptional regulator [Clostridium tagluense]MCB2300440.1 helix-turn-helix transcriptional regulator [Clostridium tagluense]